MQPNHGRKWSEITNLVKEQKSEETCVCICPYWEIYPFTYYYSKEIFTKYDEVEKLLENEKIFQLSSQNFFPDTVRCKRILFVDSGCNLENGSEELKQMKLQQYDFDAFLIEQKVLKLSRFVTE
jgi:hypothetical protein